MSTLKIDHSRLKFGTPVRIKRGIDRKPWEWIGQIQMVSGEIASVVWRVVIPGSEDERPISNRPLNQLEFLDGILAVDVE